MYILYAEDDGPLRELTWAQLRKWGHDFEAVESGEELLRRLGPHNQFDLVITGNDFGVGPRATGLGVLHRIRADMRYESLPVIVLTTSEHIKERVEELGGIFVDKGQTNMLRDLYDAIEKIRALVT